MALPTSDRLTFSDTAEALNLLMLEEKTINPIMLNTQDQVMVGPRRDNVDQPGSLSAVGYHTSGYSSDAYFSQTPSVYNGGGFDNATNEGVTYLPYVNAESLENGSHGIHKESPSVVFHGYGYSPQMPDRPYKPITTQQPSVRGPGHLYHAQQFSARDASCFQQPISPKKSCVLSSTSVSQAKFPVHIDLQGNSKRFGLKPNYAPPLESSSKGGDFLGNSDGLGFLHQGFEGSEVGGLWSDWSKPLNGMSSLLQLSSAAASLMPISSVELSRDDFEMASHRKGSFYGSCSGSRYRGYSHGRSGQGSDYGSVSTSSMWVNGQKWPTLNETRQGGRCNDFSCSCTVTLDTLSERNRGPRAFRPKVRTTEYGSAVDNGKNRTIDDGIKESYNRLDFFTNYKVAKFFIIKSYSEDNVHKSIKYGVWASTPNGNKKLDAAYREAMEKHGTCPIFLLFSVNASAQFCGVAEMVGPVDFDKSVDYWLQDKWSGQFLVKWHIIKDVPNSQFRHIILEKNDKKPVTNSRDTQEVELEQGIEILNIFKNYEIYSSILDDFHFYEQRQKAMQKRKAGQQAIRVAPPSFVVASEKQNPVSQSNDFVKTMSKSFAEALLLTEHDKEHSSFRNVVSATTAALAHSK